MIPENTDNHAVMETITEICISWQSPELNGISECQKKKKAVPGYTNCFQN